MQLALPIGQGIATPGLADLTVLRDDPTRRRLVPVALAPSIALAIAVAVTR